MIVINGEFDLKDCLYITEQGTHVHAITIHRVVSRLCVRCMQTRAIRSHDLLKDVSFLYFTEETKDD